MCFSILIFLRNKHSYVFWNIRVLKQTLFLELTVHHWDISYSYFQKATFKTIFLCNRCIELSVISFSYFALIFHRQKLKWLSLFSKFIECLKMKSWFLSFCYLWRLGYHTEETRYFIMKEICFLPNTLTLPCNLT